MNKIHLSVNQKQLLKEINATSGTIPPHKYNSLQKQIQKLPISTKPKLKKIPNVVPGYNSNEIVPLNKFDALRDLPEGWALVSCFDSGNNHLLVNAGEHVLRCEWRYFEKDA